MLFASLSLSHIQTQWHSSISSIKAINLFGFLIHPISLYFPKMYGSLFKLMSLNYHSCAPTTLGCSFERTHQSAFFKNQQKKKEKRRKNGINLISRLGWIKNTIAFDIPDVQVSLGNNYFNGWKIPFEELKCSETYFLSNPKTHFDSRKKTWPLS